MKIIAESAFNHNGSLKYLKELAFEAKKCGADFFTVQIMDVSAFCVEDYSKYNIYKENTLSFNEWEDFFSYAKHEKIFILPCALDIPSLELCVEHGFRNFKIHATDINNIPMLEKFMEYDDISIILETQCATNIEINFALNHLASRVKCIVHGFSNYPTEVEDLNLNTLDYFKNYYPNYSIGFADHSLDVEKIPLMALAKGCSFYEKHITLTRNNRNFDYQVSLYPHEFSAMVSNINHYKQALGTSMKHPVVSEKEYREVMYKKVLGNKVFKRADQGNDFMTDKINALDVREVGIALIARLKSKRLPRKILKPFYDSSLIEFLYKRLNNSEKTKKVFLATSPLPEDKELVDLAQSKSFNVFLGHPVSVIDRILGFAIQEELGAVFRVTGDNPFTDVNFIDDMIQLFWDNDLDYVRVNNSPFGVSAELFSTKYLWELYLSMINPMESEYLTQYVLEDDNARKGCIDIESDISDLKYINLSVDYQTDLERAYKLLDEFKNDDFYRVNFDRIVEKIDKFGREDKNKKIKLAGGIEAKFSDFLDKLSNQKYIVRKKIRF